jgi:hypothetical protein
MAIYQNDRQPEDIGHGTRAGFRYVSVFGIIAFVLLLTFFVWGPQKSATENPAGTTTENTPLEQVKPEPQPANPATTPQLEPAPVAPSPQPATP